jgi:hypothetical protein
MPHIRPSWPSPSLSGRSQSTQVPRADQDSRAAEQEERYPAGTGCAHPVISGQRLGIGVLWWLLPFLQRVSCGELPGINVATVSLSRDES